jgi:hypothetical protein
LARTGCTWNKRKALKNIVTPQSQVEACKKAAGLAVEAGAVGEIGNVGDP